MISWENSIRSNFVGPRCIGASSLRFGLTVINAALLPDGTIQQSEVRITSRQLERSMDEFRPDARQFRRRWTRAASQVQISDNIVAAMRMKFFGFAWNATIASLSRSRAGAIARSAVGASFVSAVIKECTRAVTTEEYLPPSDTAGLTRGLFSQPTSTYGPSLLIDVEDEPLRTSTLSAI